VINIFQSLDEAQERIQSGKQNIKGTLRLSAPLSFGIKSLTPILSGFMKRHPELKIHLQLEDHRTDFVAEGIDVGIRVGRLEDSSFVAIPITTIPTIFCASPNYLSQHGSPKTPQELTQHNCLRYSLISPKIGWAYQQDGLEKSVEVTGTLSSNNGNALKEAAIDGIGIIQSPNFIVSEALQCGQLVEILSPYRPEPLGLYAMKLSRKFTPAKVNVFVDYLKEYFSSTI
jgi:DNA-binding transcriptional LysR family regulator